MAKKMVKRTDANNEILYFYTHSDVVDVGDGNATTSLTNALNNKANTSDVQALSDDVLRKSSQILSNQEKEQVHNNLSTESFIDDRAVRYDEPQVLGSDEKAQALTNLGLNGVDDEPTPNSDNLVKSGGVFNAEKKLQYQLWPMLNKKGMRIENDTVAVGSSSNIIKYLKCKQGEDYRFDITWTGSSYKGFYIGYSANIPTVAGNSVICIEWSDCTSTETESRIIKAPADGYLFVYHTSYTTINVYANKLVDYAKMVFYAQEFVPINKTIDSAINADESDNDAETGFGKVVTVTGGNTLLSTDFIDISDSYAINIQAPYTSVAGVPRNTFGSVFYNENKEPVDVAAGYCTVSSSDYSRYEQCVLLVPSDAKYIRMTCTKSFSLKKYKTDVLLDSTHQGFSVPTTKNQYPCAVMENGNFGSESGGLHCSIPVTAGEVYLFDIPEGADKVRYAYGTSNEYVASSAIPMVSGTSVMTAKEKTKISIIIPEGCSYLLINGFAAYFDIYKYYGGVKSILDNGSFSVFQLTSDNELDYALLGNGKFGASNSYKHCAMPVAEGDVYLLETYFSAVRYAFATTNEYERDSNVPVVDGTRVTDIYGKIVITIPHGCTYLLLNGGMNTVAVSKFYKFAKDISDYIKQDIDYLSEEFNQYINNVTHHSVDIMNLPKRDYTILQYTYMYGISNTYKHVLIDVTSIASVKITANTNHNAYIAWFENDDAPVAGGTPPFIDSAQYTVPIPRGTTQILIVPDGAKFMYVYLGTLSGSAYSYAPDVVALSSIDGNSSAEYFDVDFNSRRDRQVTDMLAIGLTPLNPATDNDGWELPPTLQQLNAQKKADQLVQIKWTPKRNVPSKSHSGGIFPAGEEVTIGIPYSSNNDDGSKTVGEEVSFHTFMTAVNNPYSLLYTECVNNETLWPSQSSYPDAPTQKSYWGKVYTRSNNGFAYYGTVCCGLTSSVENSPLKWNNGVIKNYKQSNGVYVPICPAGVVDYDLLRIGDIADNKSHSFLVYGLHRDSNGQIDKVKICEATSAFGGRGGGCRYVTYNSQASFSSHIRTTGSNPFTLFRYIKLWDNTDYEPSEYVPLIDRGETAQAVTYNDAICTFAGDKATFRAGDLVVVNYNLNGTQPHTWTKIQVFKDDVLLAEYTLAQAEQSLVDYIANNDITPDPFNAGMSESNHALVLGHELAGGKYKACMSDGANTSDFTYWEVIADSLTVVEKGQDEYEVTVSGNHLIQVIYINGIGMYYLPTYEEQASRKLTVRPYSLAKLWEKSYTDYDVAVKLKGEYGNITTMPVVFIGDEVDPEPEEETNN